MEALDIKGEIADVPFAALLGGIWRKQMSGRLVLERDGAALRLAFEKGGLCIEQEDFPGAEFLDRLVRKNTIDVSLIDGFRTLCSRNNLTPLRGILESGLMPPPEIWAEITLFWKERLFPVFDWSGGTYRFEIPRSDKSVSLVRPLSLPPIVLEGIRRMKEAALIETHLPSGERKVRSLSPYILDPSELEPPVFYILELLAVPRTPEELCAASILGNRDTRNILFALICLGAAGAADSSGMNASRTAQDLSLAEMERLFSIFNEKCSYVYKYISKELGPVAVNVIEKAFADVRDRIDPALHSFSLTPDGKVEFRPFMRMNINVATEDQRREFLRSLDEILAAEVLAVKRTLGSEHEADLVKNLERVGELP